MKKNNYNRVSKWQGKASRANRHITVSINDYHPVKAKVMYKDSVVWFGKHKGLVASQVPKSYWLWAQKNVTSVAIHPDLTR